MHLVKSFIFILEFFILKVACVSMYVLSLGCWNGVMTSRDLSKLLPNSPVTHSWVQRDCGYKSALGNMPKISAVNVARSTMTVLLVCSVLCTKISELLLAKRSFLRTCQTA